MSGQDAELARDLGFLEASTLGLGTMIGAGIFVLPGIVAESAGMVLMPRGEQRTPRTFRQAVLQRLEG